MKYCLRPESEYYNYFPDRPLTSGDILTFTPGSIIPVKAKMYLVVSPACDIQNQKTDTISLLPIITIRAYFSRPAMFQHEIRKRVQKNLLPQYKQDLPLSVHGAITYLTQKMDHHQGVQRDVLVACLEWLKLVDFHVPVEIKDSLLKTCLSREGLTEIVSKLITDSYKSDVYFIPKSRLDSADQIKVKEGAIVLLRNLVSIPIEHLVHAYDSSISWSDLAKQNWYRQKSYFKSRPIKIGQLNPEYYNDLYAKYLAYQIRVGSSDFVPEYVSSIAALY